MMALLLHDVPRHALVLLGLVLATLIAAPAFADDYLLTVLIVILYFAYTGIAWNVLMGFAGQLSLGHALYVGLGAYTAAALYVHFGVAPWFVLLVAIPITEGLSHQPTILLTKVRRIRVEKHGIDSRRYVFVNSHHLNIVS